VLEVAAEAHLAGDAVVVADVAVLVDVPVVDAQGALAFECVVVGHRVEQLARPDRVGLLVGVDGHGDVVGPQEQAEVQARDPRADDADARSHRPTLSAPGPRDQWRGGLNSITEEKGVRGTGARWCGRTSVFHPQQGA
jgi:hypothetical protein